MPGTIRSPGPDESPSRRRTDSAWHYPFSTRSVDSGSIARPRLPLVPGRPIGCRSGPDPIRCPAEPRSRAKTRSKRHPVRAGSGRTGRLDSDDASIYRPIARRGEPSVVYVDHVTKRYPESQLVIGSIHVKRWQNTSITGVALPLRARGRRSRHLDRRRRTRPPRPPRRLDGAIRAAGSSGGRLPG